MAESAIEARRFHVRPSLFVFLAGSAALHASLLGFVPGFSEDRQPVVNVGALEVTLRVPTEPLPVVAPEPAAQPAPARRPEKKTLEQRETASTLLLSRSHPGPVPVSSIPSATRADPERPFEATSHAVEPSPAAPAQNATAVAQAAPANIGAAYLDSPAPRYPDAARRLGQEGTVMLRVLVSVDGLAARVALEQSSGSPYLDGAALERVRNWRFRPARQGSASVESWVIVPIVFRLEGAS